MRPRVLALVAAGSALAGAVVVLLVAWGAGWLHNTRHTVVVQEEPSAAQIATPARVRPLIGADFDPAAIYRSRSPGVVTIYSIYGSGGFDGAAQGSGFVVSKDGTIL